MREVDDWELVAQAQAGRMEAFAALVRRYQAPLIHFLRRTVNTPQDAEDLAQESFIRVYRNLARLRPQARFSTLLFSIARNLALNFLRDAKRRGRDTAVPLDGQEAGTAGTEQPDGHARLKEIEDALEQGLALLSEDHRTILLLREMQGMDYDAIAAVMGCRKGTVRSRLARAREQLRQRLLELGGDLL